jgi:hypothetical protein
MKFSKLLIIILIVFFKTGNVFSDNSIFDVNNIKIEKTAKLTNEQLANQAIKKGFEELKKKILLDVDIKKLSELSLSQMKKLVSYYQMSYKTDEADKTDTIHYNISFDKDKLHSLFYSRGISYSEITKKELFLLPILKKNNQIYVYNKNFFYDNWNKIYNNELIEFILPLENIEILQRVNSNKDNLLSLEFNDLFEEYSKENIVFIIIEDNNLKEEKIFFKAKILGKNIIKNIVLKRQNLNQDKFYEKIIIEVKKELINTIKSQNLIDIRTPSFLNAHLIITKTSNLVELNSRLKKIDLVDSIHVQEFNNKSVLLKIKYLGKLDKIIRQLEEEKIILKLIENQWSIKII